MADCSQASDQKNTGAEKRAKKATAIHTHNIDIGERHTTLGIHKEMS